jgi:diguanylate cyclase (GGDEF)-like protein
MVTTVNSELQHAPRLRKFARCNLTCAVSICFVVLIATQGIGLLILGTGKWGAGLSQSIMIVEGFVAIACAWKAFRRAQGGAALYWFLFTAMLVVLVIPTALQAYDTLFDQTVVSESTRALLYSLYGAPILMMLFLPESQRREKLKFEIFLDLFQVAIVVSLVYSTFFFQPVRGMLPADAIFRGIRLADLQSLLLMAAVLVRLQFARVSATRNLLLRLGLFLLVCAIATYVGGWIYLHFPPSLLSWYDLGWAIPELAAALIAITWVPSAETSVTSESAKLPSFLATNLVLVAMLCAVNLLMDRWKQAQGETLADAAIAASLLAFTLRLALTQFHQEEEIVQRKAAQKQLTASHHRVGRLLDTARRQTSEITQISELGSVLHASANREEIFRIIPERLRRLFPGASGCVSLLNASKVRVESVAEWGVLCPADQLFAPEQCWALRRGCTHVHTGDASSVRCSHLRGDGPSICVPLIANGESIGVLVIQNDDRSSVVLDPDADADAFARRRQLAATVAEHIALAIANVNLREALRSQAIRDPLTGLYNRRYMQEFLDRELQSARRKQRQVAVVMLDLDHFKRYNDRFGHAAGDHALAATGEMLLRSVRAEDIACRYGGEEFALILPECSLSQATARAETIRARQQEYRAQVDGEPTDPLSISIGIAAFDETTDRVDLLLKFADDALYEAKRLGGNHVVAAAPAVPLPEADVVMVESPQI